jgi:hypothetical protein
MAEPAPLDIDFEIEELETRLDRLRSLYEQYFLGIERIEPTVARKDVDRRFWMLRREKIRNTARRYKLQVLIQRYNTFQQYWHRICREIEAGTYTRHLVKAEKLLAKEALTIATKRRRGAYRKGAEEAAAEPAPEAVAASEPAATTQADEQDRELDALLGLNRGPGDRAEPAAPPPIAAATRRERARPQLQPLDLDIDDLLGGGERAPISARGTAAKRPTQSPPIRRRTPAPGSVRATRASKPPSGRTRPPASEPTPPSERKIASPPARAPGPVRAARPAPPNPRAPAESAVTEARVRELHQRLAEAKRQVQDGKSVSVEGLAKSLRSTEEKLKKEHGAHRRIEFDVVIKNGRALVKPIVR